MVNFDDLAAANLDGDGDINCSVSSDESDSIDCNDQNESASRDVGDGKFKRITDLTADEIRGLEFGSEEEAYDFYQKYAKCHGFVIRKDDVAWDIRGKVIMRQFVCNREGLRNKKYITRLDRKKDHRPVTRTNCQARLRVHYKLKTSGWEVTCFEEPHNHELTPSRYVHLIPTSRGLKDANKAQVDSLHSFGIRTYHVMGYMEAQKGRSDADVGFSKKDLLYNYFDSKIRSEIKDGDVVAALSYLHGKASNDPMLYAKFTTTSDGRLKQLFWADGCSKCDFLCFGDVLAFDMTFKKNKCNYHLVIFSGCNHHSETIIFGCALVSDETMETYKWVLKSFLDAMGNKHPKAILTDEDEAMGEAIKQIFPNSCHRICAWHLHKNACENVKSSPFLEDFKKAVYSNFSPVEFEAFWTEMVVKHELVGNKWVSKTYENRSLWATAYFRDKFFGRIRTTSQYEAINSLIKTYVRKKSNTYEFMHNFEQTLREYRHSELVADFKSLFTEPVLTTSLREIEKDAAKIYTSEIFKEVKEQLVLSGALIVIERAVNGEKLVFKMTKYCDPSIETEVVYDTSKSIFYCACRHFESRGIPCSHIFCAMKDEHVDHIPSSLILTRWTKNAKKTTFMSPDSLQGIDSDVMEPAQFGAYFAACTSFCKIAAEKKGRYNEVMADILKLTNKYEKLEELVGTQSSSIKQIGDPNMVKTKGAPKRFGTKRSRHCSNCTSTKHNSRTCPMHVGTNKKSMNHDQLSHSESSEFSVAADSDKEIMTSDVNKDQATLQSTNPRSHNDKKGKGKLGGCCNQKQKKAKESTQNSDNDCVIKQVGCSSGAHPVMSHVQPMLPPMHFPTYGYATSSQGLSNLPNFGGVPVYPHNTHIPILPREPSIIMECQLVIMAHLVLDCHKKSGKMVVKLLCFRWKGCPAVCNSSSQIEYKVSLLSTAPFPSSRGFNRDQQCIGSKIPVVIQFCSTAFAYYAQATAAQKIFGHNCGVSLCN